MRIRPRALACALLLVTSSAAAQTGSARPAGVLAEHNPCAELVDTYDDGEIDLRVRFEFDDEERLVAAHEDVGDDGQTDRVDHYRFDAEGRLAGVDTEGDVAGEVSGRLSYSYEDGRLTRETLDSDADGAIDSVYELAYDAEGRLVSELWQATDTPPEHIHYSYSRRGELAAEMVDLGDDGTVDQIITYTYGEAGLIGVDEDLDGDGVPDLRIRYRYDPNARLIVEEWRSDAGDELRGRTTFQYDTAGRLLETRLDEGDDGDVDVRTTFSYDCWLR